MNTVAIICEYNPFHNGHEYQINKIKETLHPDKIIAIMSGDFTQRGEPAIYDKYERTTMALLAGVDAVIELPVYYATSSAEFFAHAGVMLCNKLNVINTLVFGAEYEDIKVLSHIANTLATEPLQYKTTLKKYLKKGIAYPIARKEALLTFYKDNVSSFPILNDLESILSKPNNILAIEYLKALELTHSTIQPYLIKRTGANYHDEQIQTDITFSSATAIRESLRKKDYTKLTNVLPSSVLVYTKREKLLGKELYYNHFTSYFHYCFASPWLNPDIYLDVTNELSNRFLAKKDSHILLTDYLNQVYCKNYTNTRINRCFLHILLGIKKDMVGQSAFQAKIHYGKLLGFRKDASSFLSHLKKESEIPIIQNENKDAMNLSKEGMDLFLLDQFAHHLYQQVYYETYQEKPHIQRDYAIILF